MPPPSAAEAVPPEPWLAGPWAELALDPTVWGTATGEPLLGYTVKANTAALISRTAGLEPGAAMRPKLWPDHRGRGGLAFCFFGRKALHRRYTFSSQQRPEPSFQERPKRPSGPAEALPTA